MLDLYKRLAEDLFAYKEFRALFSLFEAGLWLLVGLIVVVIVLHVLYMLGRQSPLYKKRNPRANWSKHFFRAAFLVIILLVALLAGVEWLQGNITQNPEARTLMQDLLPKLQSQSKSINFPIR